MLPVVQPATPLAITRSPATGAVGTALTTPATLFCQSRPNTRPSTYSLIRCEDHSTLPAAVALSSRPAASTVSASAAQAARKPFPETSVSAANCSAPMPPAATPRVTLPPKATLPPPVSAVPGVRVRLSLSSLPLVTAPS